MFLKLILSMTTLFTVVYSWVFARNLTLKENNDRAKCCRILVNNSKDNILFSENWDKINTISFIMITIWRKKLKLLKLSYYCVHFSSTLIWYFQSLQCLVLGFRRWRAWTEWGPGGDRMIYSLGPAVSRGIGALVFFFFKNAPLEGFNRKTPEVKKA